MRSFRLVHIGVAAGIAAAMVTGMGLVQSATATGGATASSFVPIVPCRLADTRPDTTVGSRNTPLEPGETATLAVWGTNGSCTIPSDATGIASNVTAVGATQASYLALFPADAAQPTTSNLNPSPGQPPTPNQVTIGLSAAGAISLYNNAGSVDVIIDLVGYYAPAAGGGTGPKGDTGAQGAKGDTGLQGFPGTPAVNPARVIWVATNGTHPAAAGGSVPIFASVREAMASIKDNSSSIPYVIKIGPGIYTESTTISLKSYVDLEGSGEGTTTLKCTCTGVGLYGGALHASGNLVTQVRSLTVSATNAGDVSAIDIESNAGVGSVSLSHVTAIAVGGGSGFAAGIIVGSYAYAVLDSVTALGTGGSTSAGLYVTTFSEVMAVDLTANGGGASGRGVYLFEGNAAIDASRLMGTTASVASDASSRVRLSNTRLNGSITGSGASCFNTFTILYGAYNTNCTAP